MTAPADPRDRLIVALDTPDEVSALALTDLIGEQATFYKIGLGMLTTGGLAAAMELKDRGKRVFLDMKLLDISAPPAAAPARHISPRPLSPPLPPPRGRDLFPHDSRPRALPHRTPGHRQRPGLVRGVLLATFRPRLSD